MDRRLLIRAQDARKSGPKYLNSPETPLFHKGRELFALWQVKQANSKLERIVVVEGYMDVIALHQAGLPIAVATLGTATTPEHTEVLFRAAPDVVFCFDGDRAGRAAAWKALESALPRLRDGRQAYFLFLPDGEDPDSLVRKEGKDGFEKRIKEAMPLSDYFFNELSHDVNMSSLDGRARLAERARPLIAKLPDGAFRDLMAQELEKRSGARATFETAGCAARRAAAGGGAALAGAQRDRPAAGAARPGRAGGAALRLPAPGQARRGAAGRTDRPGALAPGHQPGLAGGALRRAPGISRAAEADGRRGGGRAGGAAHRVLRCPGRGWSSRRSASAATHWWRRVARAALDACRERRTARVAGGQARTGGAPNDAASASMTRSGIRARHCTAARRHAAARRHGRGDDGICLNA